MNRFFVLLIGLVLVTPAFGEAPVCKVVDGDTFHLCDGLKVRLDAVDTPEQGEPFYWEARSALARLIQTPDLKLSDCRTDRTGKRQACKVHADGKDIQAELVRQGMAWDWPRYSKGRYASEEKEAKIEKRGLWKDERATSIHWKTRNRD